MDPIQFLTTDMIVMCIVFKCISNQVDPISLRNKDLIVFNYICIRINLDSIALAVKNP